MDSTKKQLIANAIELFTKHNVKQGEMFDLIRDAITKTVAEKPKTLVLYNACHGGYGVTHEFQEFAKDIQHILPSKDEFREKAPAYMQAFGKHILDNEEMVGLREHLCYYAKNVFLKDLFVKRIASIHGNKIKLDNLERNAKELEAYIADSRSTIYVHEPIKPYISYLLSNKNARGWFIQCTRFDLRNLMSQVGTKKDELASDIAKDEQAILTHVDTDVYEDMMTHYQEMQKIQKKCDGDDEKPFVTLLLEKGYKNDLSIWHWKTQQKYTFMAITYVISRNLRFHETPSEETIRNIEHEFGLLCASDTCSNLAIAEVPGGMSWKVGQYDGLEKVYIV